MLLFRSVLLFVAMVSVVNSAAAQSQARDQALLLYERAEEHFRSGEYERSTLLLREAIDLFDAAPMHFNLAKSLHQTRDLEAARDEYALFLEMEPETPRRPEVEARIAQISAEIAARDAIALEPEPEPEPGPEPIIVPEPGEETEGPETMSTSRPLAPWIVMASSALPIGGAVVCGVLFSNEVDAARSAADQRMADEHRSSADTLALTANILYGVGGAVALGGLIWGIVSLSGGDNEDAETPRAQLSVGPSYAGIEGTF